MLVVKKIDHITINIKNLAQSKKFYGEILGLEAAGFIDMGDHTLTYFSMPQGIRLELIDYREKNVEKLLTETDVGTYRHICFEVDNLLELVQRCKDHGIFIRQMPTYVEKLQCNTMLLTDPNDVEIEMIQR